MTRNIYGRTAVRPAVAATAVGLVALVGSAIVVQQRALAMDVVFQDSPSQFSASRLTGSNMAFGTVTADVSDGTGDTTSVPVLRGGFDEARIDGLCVSQQQELLGVPYTIRVNAGDGTLGTYDVSSASATFDLVSVTGGEEPGVALDGLVQIGQTSSDVTTTPGVDNPLGASTSGQPNLAIDASGGELTQVRGRVYGFAIDRADRIEGLVATIVPGDHGCDGADLPS